MGQGGRGNYSCSRLYSLSPLRLNDTLGVGDTKRNMASGDSPSSSSDSSASSTSGYIHHTVTRLDTLAGLAIKYGCEVSDIKRINGLVTDLQMFARKSLRIPLPGRHTPSWSPYSPRFQTKSEPRLGKQASTSGKSLSALKESNSRERRSITSAMGLLRGYYGLSTTRSGDEGTEMAVYKSDSDYHSEDEPFSPQRKWELFDDRVTSNSRSHVDLTSSSGYGAASTDAQREGCNILVLPKLEASGHHPITSKSILSRMETSPDSLATIDADRLSDRLVRRRAKGEGGNTSLESLFETPTTAEIGICERAPVPSRSPAPRSKIPSRPVPEQETSIPMSRPVGFSQLNGWHSSSESPGIVPSNVTVGFGNLLGGKAVEGFISKIRKSASNPTLYEERRPLQTSPAPRLGSKGDLSTTISVNQGIVQSGVISSVLEGFPKPGTIRRHKAALD